MTTVTYPSIQINLGGGDFVNFVRDQIVDASIVEEINLVSVELSVNALEFTVNNSVESFNMFNGEIYTKLKEHLEIEVYEYIDNTKVCYIGLFYLKTWKNLSDTQIKFTAKWILSAFWLILISRVFLGYACNIDRSYG